MRLLVYGDTGGSGGYLRYCRGLFASGSIPPDLEVTFVCDSGFRQELMPLDESVRVIAHPWPGSRSRLHRYIWYLANYPTVVRRFRPDVEFYPSGQLRTYGRRARTVVTCHNLLLFDDREMKRLLAVPGYAGFARYRARQARSFRRASGVIFLSEHSRRVVRQALPGLPRDTVVPHGLDDDFRFPNRPSYRLNQPVRILYVSSVWPYKRQAEVIRAVTELRQRRGADFVLRLVGGGPAGFLTDLQGLIRREGAEDYVQVMGEASRAALLNEYRDADLFVFASACETFGITLLEAMGARLPIACSNATGLGDIARDAAVYFEPSDASSIAAALAELIASETERRRLGEQAFCYSQEYRWERSARETFDFIRQVAS